MAVAESSHSKQFLARIDDQDFPCVGAKSAAAHEGIEFFEAGDLREADHDAALLKALQDFAGKVPEDALFVSLVALFPDTPALDEPGFERALWQRLQALHGRDADDFAWDPEVSSDPASP